MALNKKKLAEQGWFYHAPAKPKPRTGPVPVPPISQIPILGNMAYPPGDDCPQMWFKSTDSDYVRLAKMGGRANLLQMHDPPPKSDKPVGYPRCEWFYDSQYTDPTQSTLPQEPYEFMLPDYMVHNAVKPCAKKDDCGGGPSQENGGQQGGAMQAERDRKKCIGGSLYGSLERPQDVKRNPDAPIGKLLSNSFAKQDYENDKHKYSLHEKCKEEKVSNFKNLMAKHQSGPLCKGKKKPSVHVTNCSTTKRPCREPKK